MAVYTEVSDEELESLIARYDIGRLLSCKGIAEGVENTNYVVHTTGGAYILTLYEKRVAADDLPFFLGLLEHLSNRGITCPLPVHTKAGDMLVTVAGRTAALFTFLEGVSVKRPEVAHCTALGRALAELHKAAAGFSLRRPNALGLTGWHTLFERFRDRADEITPGLEATIAAELSELTSIWPATILETGIIHADLFPDNVFFLEGEISGLIDFYFACSDALAYDAAICLNAWCFEPDVTFNRDKARGMLGAYANVRPFAAAEREAFPLLARGAALRFLLTRSHDWLNTPKDALVKPHDPLAYLKRLTFLKTVKEASTLGLEEPA